jgi:hypothetical protein
MLLLPVQGADQHQIIFELRLPKSIKPAPLTSFDLVTEDGLEGTRLRLTKQREEPGFNIFQESFLIFVSKRNAMVVRPDNSKQSQVFVMSLPKPVKPIEWTEWKKPSYIDVGNATWDFMHGLKSDTRSTNIPPNCFEFRYKIEKTP